MAIATQTISHHQVRNDSIGRFTTDSTGPVDTSFNIGYTPRYVRVINLTDGNQLEWFEGMAPDSAVQTTAAGAASLITTAGITANSTIAGFSLKAASLPASKTFTYQTIG